MGGGGGRHPVLERRRFRKFSAEITQVPYVLLFARHPGRKFSISCKFDVTCRKVSGAHQLGAIRASL